MGSDSSESQKNNEDIKIIFKKLRKKKNSELKNIIQEGRNTYSRKFVYAAEEVYKERKQQTVFDQYSKNKFLFRLTLITILIRNIRVVFIALFLGGRLLTIGLAGLLFDVIFLSYVSIGKNWAKILLKVKYIISFIVFAGVYYSTKNYWLGSLDLVLIFCIILLLFTKTYSKFPKYTFITYCVGFLALNFLQIHGVYQEYKEKKILSKIESTLEYTSKFHYVIKLPSNDWKFIPKDDGAEIMGVAPDEIDIAVANKSTGVFGIFIPEEITEYNIERNVLLKKVSEYMKKDKLAGFKIIGEKDIRGGKLWLTTSTENGIKCTYAFAWKAYNTIALNTTFRTINKDKEYLSYWTQKFLDNTSEVPLKKRLLPKKPK